MRLLRGVLRGIVMLALYAVCFYSASKLLGPLSFSGPGNGPVIFVFVFFVLMPVVFLCLFIGFLKNLFYGDSASTEEDSEAEEEEDEEEEDEDGDNEEDEDEEDEDSDTERVRFPSCNYCGKAISAGETLCSSCQAPVPRTPDLEKFERTVRKINAREGKESAIKFYIAKTGANQAEAKEYVESL